jgi:hypothetical protein
MADLGSLPPSEQDLGLDQPLPWNDKFHIQPGVFNAEGFVPEPPASYLEALKRQQRLLHGQSRRQSQRLHQVRRGVSRHKFRFGQSAEGMEQEVEKRSKMGRREELA